MNEPFLKRILNKPPLLFPWVALFHAAMLLYLIVSNLDEPFPSPMWVQPIWMLAFTITWLFSCDLKRWAAFAYIGLTSLDIVLRLLLKYPQTNPFCTSLFPFDILFSFFLFFYFKRFE